MLGNAAKVLGLDPHVLMPSCDEYAKILDAGAGDIDAMLTELAKGEPDRVAVDVDEQGTVWYRVASAPGEPIPRLRIDLGEGANASEELLDDGQSQRAARTSR